MNMPPVVLVVLILLFVAIAAMILVAGRLLVRSVQTWVRNSSKKGGD